MPRDGDHGGFPGKREDFPDGRERSPLRWIPGCVHRYLIATTTDVRDDGAGAGPWQAGVGLLAMRVRAAELGGTLTAGPGPDGGTVRACFPLPAKEAS